MSKPEIKSAVMTGRAVINHRPEQKMTKEEFAKQIRKLRDRDSEMVTGIFKNLETPGGGARFMYKQYPGDDFVAYELFDGQAYRIPRGVARHLNNNCFYWEYQHMNGESGEQGLRLSPVDARMGKTDSYTTRRKVHRFAFHSLEYMEEEAPVDIVEVSKNI